MGQYYHVATTDDSSEDDTPADLHQEHPREGDHGNPFALIRAHPFLQASSRNTNCSKFKTHLKDMVALSDDSLVSLECFVDSTKGALQAALSSHRSFAAYADWTHTD
jgi:hypothetical protein